MKVLDERASVKTERGQPPQVGKAKVQTTTCRPRALPVESVHEPRFPLGHHR